MGYSNKEMASSFSKRMPSAGKGMSSEKLEKLNSAVIAGNSSNVGMTNNSGAGEISSRKSTAVSATSRVGSGSAINKRNMMGTTGTGSILFSS